MTDKEAYELLLKYCGGKKGLLMIKEMIRVAGVDTAIKNTMKVLKQQHPNVRHDDFEVWVRQSYEYVQKQMSNPLN